MVRYAPVKARMSLHIAVEVKCSTVKEISQPTARSAIAVASAVSGT